MSGPKRRLPVLKNDDGAADEEPRPPWHWIGFGTAAIFTAWLPLAYLGNLLQQRLFARFAGDDTPEEIANAIKSAAPDEMMRLRIGVLLLLALPLALAAFAGGYLVGRWGKEAGVREALLAGLATGLVTCVLAWGGAGFSWAALAGAALATPMSAWGGAWGRSARARSSA
jgi:hypothetical protein